MVCVGVRGAGQGGGWGMQDRVSIVGLSLSFSLSQFLSLSPLSKQATRLILSIKVIVLSEWILWIESAVSRDWNVMTFRDPF